MKRDWIPTQENTKRKHRWLPNSRATALLPLGITDPIEKAWGTTFPREVVHLDPNPDPQGRCADVIISQRKEEDTRLSVMMRDLYVMRRAGFSALKRARHQWTADRKAYKAQVIRRLTGTTRIRTVVCVTIALHYVTKGQAEQYERVFRKRYQDIVYILLGFRHDAQFADGNLKIQKVYLRFDHVVAGNRIDNATRSAKWFDKRWARLWSLQFGEVRYGYLGKHLHRDGWRAPSGMVRTRALQKGLADMFQSGTMVRYQIRRRNETYKELRRRGRGASTPLDYNGTTLASYMARWDEAHPKPRHWQKYANIKAMDELRHRIAERMSYNQCSHVKWSRGVFEPESHLWCAANNQEALNAAARYLEQQSAVNPVLDAPEGLESKVAIADDRLSHGPRNIPMGLLVPGYLRRVYYTEGTTSAGFEWGQIALATRVEGGMLTSEGGSVSRQVRSLPEIGRPSGIVCESENFPTYGPTLNTVAEQTVAALSELRVPPKHPLNFTLGRSLAELKDFAPQLATLAEILGFSRGQQYKAAIKAAKNCANVIKTRKEAVWLEVVAEELSRAGFRVSPGKRLEAFARRFFRSLPRINSVKAAIGLWFMWKFAIAPTIADINTICKDVEDALLSSKKGLLRIVRMCRQKWPMTVKVDAKLPQELKNNYLEPWSVNEIVLNKRVPAFGPLHLRMGTAAGTLLEWRPGFDPFAALNANTLSFPNYWGWALAEAWGESSNPDLMAPLWDAEVSLLEDLIRTSPQAQPLFVAKAVQNVERLRLFGRFSAKELTAYVQDALTVDWTSTVMPLVTAWEITPLSFILDWCFATRQVAEYLQRALSDVGFLELETDREFWFALNESWRYIYPSSTETRRSVELRPAYALDAAGRDPYGLASMFDEVTENHGWKTWRGDPRITYTGDTTGLTHYDFAYDYTATYSNYGNHVVSARLNWEHGARLWGALFHSSWHTQPALSAGRTLQDDVLWLSPCDTWVANVTFAIQAALTEARVATFERGPLQRDFLAGVNPRLTLDLDMGKMTTIALLLIASL